MESRLRPPRQLVPLVRRDRTIPRLLGSAAPVIVLASPGGYGKTVTLAQWLEADPRPAAWLQAEPSDDDPLLFLRYLVAALAGILAIDPRAAERADVAPFRAPVDALPALAAAIAGAEPFILVIDDADLISSPASWDLVEGLIEALPPRATICLAGRGEPPLPLARLRAQGRVCELGVADLALDSDEIAELLALHGVAADPATVAYLARITEGWAAGLCLAALASTAVSRADWLAGIRGHRGDIAQYLASEVLERTPADVRRFLLDTSILGRLSPGLCRAVTGNPDAGERLRSVARSNLFLGALDDSGTWFRYHHLFADFLRAELGREDEVRVGALHARAAAWFEANEGLEDAVRHWLAAGDAGRAGAIVCRAHLAFSPGAGHAALRRWLEMFSDEQILADHALTVTAGYIGPMMSDEPRGLRWMNAALRMRVAGDERWPGTDLPVRALQAGLLASLALDGISQMRRDAEVMVRLSHRADPATQAAAAVLMGQACWLAGDPETAAWYLGIAEAEGAIAHRLAELAAVGFQVLTLVEAGDWVDARRRLAGAMGRFQDAGCGWLPPILPLFVAKIRLATHDGDPAAALDMATVEAMIRQANTPGYSVLLVRVIVAESLTEAGELTEAARWVRAGMARLATYPDAGILGPRLDRARERIEGRRLLAPLTRAERRVLDLLPSERSEKEIAAELSVSPDTVHSHIAALYRKLDAHGRSEAVGRARAIGFLDP